MKKVISLILVFVLLMAFASCGEVVNNPIIGNVDGEIKGEGGGGGGAKLYDAFGRKTEAAVYDDSYSAVPEGYVDGAYYEGKDYPSDYAENGQIQAGTLTAGEHKDVENLDEWLEFLNKNDKFALAENWKLLANTVIKVSVVNGENPVKNAKVVLYDANDNVIFSAVTDAKGNAYLFYNVRPQRNDKPKYIKCKAGDSEVSYTYNGEKEITLTLNANIPTVALDLMFMVDTTGSMGDELEYLKAELAYVVNNIRSNSTANLKIRTSVNFYRDTTDQYVVRYFAFKDDIQEAVSNIMAQSSDGGGDYPEAVHTALDNAVNGHAWSEDDGTVKIMFLVLDAPAHDDAKIKDSLYDSVMKAAEKGIRIIPVASSGVDDSTEVMCRTFAALTGGTYTFITDDSGIGNSHQAPTVSDYTVEKLNDLMIRVINEYCE